MTSFQDWNEQTLVEKRLIEQLQELGYEHIPGSSLESERESLAEVILKERLKKAIKRLNPWIDENNLAKIIHTLTHIEATGLMQANEKFHDFLVNYMFVQQDLGRGKKNQTVKRLISMTRTTMNFSSSTSSASKMCGVRFAPMW